MDHAFHLIHVADYGPFVGSCVCGWTHDAAAPATVGRAYRRHLNPDRLIAALVDDGTVVRFDTVDGPVYQRAPKPDPDTKDTPDASDHP